MRRLSCARRKVATAGCEGGGVLRGVSGGGGGVFPHYKFNLTNGSENLETMEYMKCGRVYHAGGDVGWFRRQYCQGRSIFSESTTARGPSGLEGGECGSLPPGMQANCKTCFWHDKKSRAEVDARFLSYSDRVARTPLHNISSLVSFDRDTRSL